MKIINTYFIVLACLIALGSCKKLSSTKKGTTDTVAVTPVSPYTNPKTATAVCDYDVSDTALTNHGWTKAFDDEFTGDLSNWTALQGGMITEQECYEPANVQIVNGALQITAKKQTITGPKTVGNDTTASFNYTSGWITCNTGFSANT